jgi:type IV pilus secretin PilQ/predicted competence protein
MTPLPRLLRPAAAVVALALAAARAEAQEQDPLITLNVRDESVANVLHALAAQHRLSLVAGDQLAGKVSINLYDVPLGEALRQILATQGMTIVREGAFHRVLTLEQLRAQQQAADAIGTRVFTLNHIGPAEAAKLVQPLLSTEGQLSTSDAAAGAGGSGGSSGTAPQGGTGLRPALVVRDHASVLANVATSLAQLDRPPPQVLLEATILSIDLGEDNRLGVDINVLGGIDFRSAGTTTDLTGLGPYSTGGAQFDDSLISGQTFGFAGQPPSAGLSFAYIQNNVAAFVEALERTTNATIVSNPRVIALNGEQAEIIVGGRLGYTTVTQNDTSTIETVQFLDTGTQLVFRPQVGEDGWIRMEVHPQNSSGVIDPVTGVPSESTTEITTRILMRDGQTLILGGLIGESVTTTREQIPLLGSLPVLGVLFGRTQEQITRRELVILLTPHILDPVSAARDAATARERFAAVRRSHWDRLSPYIRPSIANRMLTDARVLQTTGELDRALGAVEWALAMDPTNADAAVLRDELLEALALRNLPRDEAGSAIDLLRSLPTANGGPK